MSEDTAKHKRPNEERSKYFLLTHIFNFFQIIIILSQGREVFLPFIKSTHDKHEEDESSEKGIFYKSIIYDCYLISNDRYERIIKELRSLTKKVRR